MLYFTTSCKHDFIAVANLIWFSLGQILRISMMPSRRPIKRVIDSNPSVRLVEPGQAQLLAALAPSASTSLPPVPIPQIASSFLPLFVLSASATPRRGLSPSGACSSLLLPSPVFLVQSLSSFAPATLDTGLAVAACHFAFAEVASGTHVGLE